MRLLRTAVAGGFALLLASCGGAAPGVRDHTAFACPDPTATPRTEGPGTLPPGASAAMICYRDNHDLWFAPAGALRDGVPGLVHVVNAQRLRRSGPPKVCDADLGPAYVVLFRYADGTRTISGENGGCRDVRVGSADRSGSRHVFAAYLHALARQRAHARPPQTRDLTPGCPTVRFLPFSPLADPAHLVVASRCDTFGGPWGQELPGHPLTPSQVTALRHDLATARSRTIRPAQSAHYCRAPVLRGPLRVSAMDQWGDRFVVDLACDTYRYLPRGGTSLVTVRLLPATARKLTRG